MIIAVATSHLIESSIFIAIYTFTTHHHPRIRGITSITIIYALFTSMTVTIITISAAVTQLRIQILLHLILLLYY